MDTDELRSMKELINSNNEEDIRSSFIYYHQHLKHALNVSDDDPQNLRSSASIDTLSNVLKPEDCGLIAVKTLGNGNCDDRHSTLLRYLVAAELYLNAEQYANHPVLREAQSDNRMFTDHIDTIFSLLLTDESCDEFDRVRCKNSTVKFEARLTCRNFRWSSLIHLLALVNIMDRPIFSVYPSVNEGFRSLFHRIIYPVRQYNYSESNNNQPTFGIMWTRDGDLDSRQDSVLNQTTSR
ncbi:unnamed protein product [Mytilus edulis]|uniref:Uncharacterized protein n=1 Tax=Mytilus edulis TaxID=6550 RepID=A0A8S3V6Q1_MYTED|nr:unnamed protein product [Mytilus edulis]